MPCCLFSSQCINWGPSVERKGPNLQTGNCNVMSTGFSQYWHTSVNATAMQRGDQQQLQTSLATAACPMYAYMCMVALDHRMKASVQIWRSPPHEPQMTAGEFEAKK
jgi:protein tyrosine phosphatase (PTP) superfamily phosphohydrolase (DUF442 family)